MRVPPLLDAALYWQVANLRKLATDTSTDTAGCTGKVNIAVDQ